MAILDIAVGFIGQVGISPRRIYITSTDNFATITSPGYLSNSVSSSYQIAQTDIVDMIYSYNKVTGSGTYSEFLPVFNNGVITLVINVVPPGQAEPLTTTNDTNVTLTLSGTSSEALLEAVNITAGWSGLLGTNRGGTNISSYALGDMIYSSAANVLSKLSGNILSTKKFLTQTGTGTVSAAPSWGDVNNTDIVGIISPSQGGTGENNGLNTITTAGNLNFANSFTTSGNFPVTQAYTGSTNVTFPRSGTLATTSQLPTPSALVEVDDTNITLTLGGTPSAALLQPVSITAGWTGTLSALRGGTGINNGTSTFTIGGNTAFSGAFTFTGTVTGNTAITFPTSGTLATVNQIPTGAALTEVNDTNITLTLGGSASTALVNAASITAGWAGTLSIARGGLNSSSTPTLGTILTGTGTAWHPTTATYPSAATSSGSILQANGTNWISSTITWPTSITKYSILIGNSSTSVVALITSADGIFVTDSTGSPGFSSTIPLNVQNNITTVNGNSITAGSSTTLTIGSNNNIISPTRTSWTPILSDSSGHSFTMSVQDGYYIIYGNVYFIWISISWTGLGSAIAGNNVQLSLPVTLAANPIRACFAIGAASGMTAVQLMANANANQNFINLFSFNSGSLTQLIVSNFSTSGFLQVSGYVGA